MRAVAVVLFLLLAGVAAGQIVSVIRFRRALRRFARPRLADDACPKAAVVLCLRGHDPFLPDTVAALLSQDYPDYRVVIVVDHPDDASRRVVDEAIARQGSVNVTVQPLVGRRATCSLKCSSFVQAVSSLDPSVEIVAQLDADTVPHATWLRELAAALADPHVGAATGNRWYMPITPTAGSLVRYLWNVGAVVQMYDLTIAWGGTLAIKTKVIREAGLVDRWSLAFCEDTMQFDQLRRHGYDVRFVPSLMMVNRESCDLFDFCRWMPRQLLTARLYHSGWPTVVRDTLLTTLSPFVALAGLLWSVARADATAVLWWGGALILSQVIALSLVVVLEAAVRPIPESRHQPTRWVSAGTLVKLVWLLPLTQAIGAWGIVSALRIRKVEWRGVTYVIGGPWQIQMTGYEPFDRPRSKEIEGRSL